LSENTDYVCKLKKALYGRKQAPRAWYSRLDKYLQQAGFRKGSADNNLYIKVSQGNILLIEVYVDDIIFGSDDDRLSQKFEKDMQSEFEMSLLGELFVFLGLQIRQRNQGIFISQTKYIREMLKRFGMEDCKLVITPMQTNCKLSKDNDSKSTDQRKYRSMIGMDLSSLKMNPKEKVKDFNQRFLTLKNRIPTDSMPAESLVIAYYTKALHQSIAI
jgi:hypothetical protein